MGGDDGDGREKDNESETEKERKGERELEVRMNSEIVGEILLIAKNFGRGRLLAVAQLYWGRMVMGEQKWWRKCKKPDILTEPGLKEMRDVSDHAEF